eukprot:TRINITY_DN11106_c0_g2_i1.p1 TRINITY_DN11106_c0_g2~~TRINITY_DN11106_c0_g2_i1.p1  ORF type:complete len:126 (+),score=21.08 TRINITY_DN11106_c0_g2_i1:54-380(+)
MSKLCVNPLLGYIQIKPKSIELLFSEVRRKMQPVKEAPLIRVKRTKIVKEAAKKNGQTIGELADAKEFPEINSTTLLGNLNNTDIGFFIEKMQRFPRYFATKGMCSFE